MKNISAIFDRESAFKARAAGSVSQSPCGEDLPPLQMNAMLRQQLVAHAPGLTPRAALETLAGILMLDVIIPTTDGRELLLCRHTEPTPEQSMLLERLGKRLPEQPPPRIRGGPSDPAPDAKAIRAS